jgi:anti-anti-sigma factor
VVGALSGEVDQSNANALLKTLAGAIPNTATGVVVDCTELRYVDSAGVYILFTLARRLGAHQQRLAVVAPTGSHVEQVFRLTELQQVAGVHPTREEAIQGLASE